MKIKKITNQNLNILKVNLFHLCLLTNLCDSLQLCQDVIFIFLCQSSRQQSINFLFTDKGQTLTQRSHVPELNYPNRMNNHDYITGEIIMIYIKKEKSCYPHNQDIQTCGIIKISTQEEKSQHPQGRNNHDSQTGGIIRISTHVE